MNNLSDLIEFKLNSHHSNRNSKPKNNKMTPSLINLFKKNNEMDYKLYELCKEIYV